MENLPYVTAAFICEKVLQEKDGTLSAIRIVDRAEIRLQANISTPNLKDVISAIQLTGLIAIKAGPFTGKGVVTIDGEKPSGETKRIGEFPVNLGGGDNGQNIILNLTIASKEDGLHWFTVRFNDNVLSKIPLTLVRIVEQTGTDAKTNEPPKKP